MEFYLFTNQFVLKTIVNQMYKEKLQNHIVILYMVIPYNLYVLFNYQSKLNQIMAVIRLENKQKSIEKKKK